MKTRVSKTKITFSNISNESQLESVTSCAATAHCKVEMSDFSTKATVTGDLAAFIEAWNAQLS